MQPYLNSHKKPSQSFVDRGLQICFEAEQAFIGSEDPEKKLSAAQTLNKSGRYISCENTATVGAMFIELSSCDAFSPDERIDFLSRGKDLLEHALRLEPKPYHQQVLNAGIILANLGIFQCFAVDLAPSREVLDDTYEKTINYSRTLLRNSEDTIQCSGKTERSSNMRGAEAELAVLVMLKRFEITELQDQSWVAIPSHYSENKSKSIGGLLRSWDISGYTRLDENNPYELAYPIQVKSYRQSDNKNRRYDERITVVHVGDDLALQPINESTTPSSKPLRFPPHVMLQHLIDEYDGDQSKTYGIEKRTEILLDKLG